MSLLLLLSFLVVIPSFLQASKFFMIKIFIVIVVEINIIIDSAVEYVFMIYHLMQS